MDPLTIMLLMSVAQAGYSMYAANQQRDSAIKAQNKAEKTSVLNQSSLVASQYKKRRAEGTVLGQGSVSSQAIADRGSILTSTPTTRSLLGG
jgi:DNA invertase Pin-like site-specific DNA recombinase